MLIWNCVMLVANAARATVRMSTAGHVGRLGARRIAADEHHLPDVVGDVAAHRVEVQRQAAGVDDLPQRVPVRVPERRELRRVGDVETAQHAALGDALDLGDGGLDRMVRDRGEAGEALGVRRAEVGEPLVVDAHDLDGRPRGRSCVPWRRGSRTAPRPARRRRSWSLDPELGVGEPANAALAIRRRVRWPPSGPSGGCVPGRTRVPPSPCRTGDRGWRPSSSSTPAPSVRRSRRACGPSSADGALADEEIGRQPAEVDVTVGRDHLVAHRRISSG